MINVKREIKLDQMSLLLYVTLDCDYETGVYCREWEVFEIRNPGNILVPSNLRDFDLRLLPADELIVVTKTLESIINENKDGFGTFGAYFRLLAVNN